VSTDTRALPPVILIDNHRWLVASKSSPGDYHSVTYLPAVSCTCSCIKGRFLAKSSNVAFEKNACRHVRSVIDHLRDQLPPAPIRLGEYGGDSTEDTADLDDAFGGPPDGRPVEYAPFAEDLERMTQDEAQADRFERLERDGDELR
jgi:hypothetical protein